MVDFVYPRVGLRSEDLTLGPNLSENLLGAEPLRYSAELSTEFFMLNSRSGRRPERISKSSIVSQSDNPDLANLFGSALSANHNLAVFPTATVNLLGKYLIGKCAAGEQALLAGALVFPHDIRAAALMSEGIRRTLSDDQRAELLARAAFPHDSRAAELTKLNLSAEAGLSVKLRAELYAHECFPGDTKAQGEAARLYERFILALRSTAPEESLRRLVEFVRTELNSNSALVSRDSDLARLIGINEEQLGQALSNQRFGLSYEERTIRQQRLLNQPGEPAKEFRRQMVSALRTLVQLENELHRDGAISELSSDEKLASLFGVELPKIQNYLRLMRREDQVYRSHILGGDEEAHSTDQVIDSVREEIEQYRAEKLNYVRTNAELVEVMGVSPVVVFRHLAELLDPRERSYRDEALKFQETREDPALERLVLSRVKEEIRAHRAGQLCKLSTWEDLAVVFQSNALLIGRYLDQLTSEDKQYRLKFLAIPDYRSQQDTTHPVVSFVREEIKAFKRGELHDLGSDQELAKIFKCHALEIRRQITDLLHGLSVEELRLRKEIQSYQHSRGVSVEAAKRIALDLLKDQLVTELNREQRLTQPSLDKPDRTARPEKRERGSIHYEGRVFDSIEEAACGLLMERYLPGFKLQLGRTQQISIGERQIDFLVGRTFVEYHPILLFKTKSGAGAFKSWEDYRFFQEFKKALNGDAKRNFIEETRSRLENDYRAARIDVLGSSPQYRDYNLVVVTSPEQLYDRVIATLGRNVPSRERFLKKFNQLRARISKTN